MEDIVIVGAGGFGRDIVSLIQKINAVKLTWNIKGFIDDNPHALGEAKSHYKIIGTIKDWQPSEKEKYVIAIASPQSKEKVITALKRKGANFATLVTPHTFIGDYTKIGEGCVLYDAEVGDNVTVGNFAHLMVSIVGQDSIIGDYSTLTAYVNTPAAIIGKRVFVGSHSVILNNRKIGDDAFICVGSIVTNNVSAGTKVMGYPAKKVGF